MGYPHHKMEFTWALFRSPLERGRTPTRMPPVLVTQWTLSWTFLKLFEIFLIINFRTLSYWPEPRFWNLTKVFIPPWRGGSGGHYSLLHLKIAPTEASQTIFKVFKVFAIFWWLGKFVVYFLVRKKERKKERYCNYIYVITDQ